MQDMFSRRVLSSLALLTLLTQAQSVTAAAPKARSSAAAGQTRSNNEPSTAVEDPSAQHIMFCGHADEPLSINKSGEIQLGDQSVTVTKINDGAQPTVAHPSEPSPPKPPFETVLQQNWATWTAKSHGKLSPSQISAILDNDKTLPADQIAALNALAQQSAKMAPATDSDHHRTGRAVTLELDRNGDIEYFDGKPQYMNMAAAASLYAAAGPSETANAQPSTEADKPSAATSRQFTMVNGSAFISHADPVGVTIPGGSVNIPSGAAVYIVKRGNATAVFKLANTTTDPVIVSSAGDNRPVELGRAMVVCSDPAAEFDANNPCKTIIDSSTAKLVNSNSAARTFMAVYSPVAVLNDSAQIGLLMKSTDPKDQALASQILKTAATLAKMALP